MTQPRYSQGTDEMYCQGRNFWSVYATIVPKVGSSANPWSVGDGII